VSPRTPPPPQQRGLTRSPPTFTEQVHTFETSDKQFISNRVSRSIGPCVAFLGGDRASTLKCGDGGALHGRYLDAKTMQNVEYLENLNISAGDYDFTFAQDVWAILLHHERLDGIGSAAFIRDATSLIQPLLPNAFTWHNAKIRTYKYKISTPGATFHNMKAWGLY